MNSTFNPVPLALIDAVLSSAHGAELGSGESTHDAALKFVAQIVLHSQDTELILEIVKARLPKNYVGNTLKEVPGMVASAIKKGFEQPSHKGGSREPKQSTDAIDQIQCTGMTLSHDALGRTYATFNDHVNGCVVVPIESSEMERRINYAYFKANGKALAQAGLSEVLSTLIARASFDGNIEEIHLRIGSDGCNAYIDRGSDENSFIKLADGDWSVVDAAPTKFRRSAGFEQLPIPTRDADPTDMQDLLGLDNENFVLFVAFLLMCLNPRGPYMLLLVQSGQGSGKSYLCSAIKTMIDPSVVTKLRLPSTERDLAIQAKDYRLLSYDNASSIKSDMSDAFCTLATGGAFTTRKLYKDDEAQIFQHCRPVVMNGIGDFAYRPDLLERSIMLKLSPISENKRKTEREMDEQFKMLLPGFLGFLYGCAAYALHNLDKVDPPRSIRMADAAHFVVAAEPATGFKQGQFLQALEHVRDEIMIDRAVNDSLALALIKVLERLTDKRFEGRVGELFDKIAVETADQRIALPKSPSSLSNALQRSQPMLAKIGLMIEFSGRTNQGSNVRLWLDDNVNREDRTAGTGQGI